MSMLVQGPDQLDAIIDILDQDGIIAYPTEGVFGLGCNPRSAIALERLRRLKARPPGQGFILIADKVDKFAAWLVPRYLGDQRLSESATPPTTWVVPAQGEGLELVAGIGQRSLAVRIIRHPPAQQLCRLYGKALTSTSANPPAKPPATSTAQVLDYFPGKIEAVLDAPVGSASGSSRIIDLVSTRILRE